MKTLGFGQFIGERRTTVDVQGFAFVEVIDRPAEHVPLHTHEDAHFLVVARGLYESSAAGIDGRCGQDTVIFNPPGTTHRDHFVGTGGRFLTFSVRPDRFNQLKDVGPVAERAIALTTGPATRIAYRLRRELRHMDFASSLILESLAIELLAHTTRASTGRGAVPGWLRKAVELIEEGWDGSTSIGVIAATVGVHPYHLTRTFRRHFQVTPGEYLREFRMKRAAELVGRTSLPLSEVALRCGYADQSQLTRSFRRHFGFTPGSLRRR